MTTENIFWGSLIDVNGTTDISFSYDLPVLGNTAEEQRQALQSEQDVSVWAELLNLFDTREEAILDMFDFAVSQQQAFDDGHLEDCSTELTLIAVKVGRDGTLHIWPMTQDDNPKLILNTPPHRIAKIQTLLEDDSQMP